MGKSSNTKVLLLIAVFVLGIYILPSAVAKYAGSHTWELNETSRVTGLQCGLCHTYIVNEINSSITEDVMWKHRNASNNSAFVGPTGVINISFTPQGNLTDVCWMCHVVQNEYAATTGGHTKVVIRVCTDTDCHGDSSSGDNEGMCEVYTSGLSGANSSCNITGKISSTVDAHWNFFVPLEAIESSIGRENGSGNYGSGFFACLGCHTHVGMDLNITRPQKVSLWLNLTSITAGFNATQFSVNFTNMTSVVGGKEPGSVFV